MTWETMWVPVFTLAQMNNDDQAHVNACSTPLLFIVLFNFLGTKTGVVTQSSSAGLVSRKHCVSTPGLKAMYTSPPGRPYTSPPGIPYTSPPGRPYTSPPGRPYTSPPGRPVDSNAISTSLGSIR